MVAFIVQVAAPTTSQLSAAFAFVWLTLLTASANDNVDDNGDDYQRPIQQYMTRTITPARLNTAELFKLAALANMQCLMQGELGCTPLS